MLVHGLDIEQSLRDKYKKLREHIAQLKKRNSVINNPASHSHVQFEAEASAAEDQRLDDYEAEIDTLLKQLSNYQEIIAQQEEVIKVSEEVWFFLINNNIVKFMIERNGK